MRPGYRVRQFWQALTAAPPREPPTALAPELQALYRGMPRADRAHGLRTYRRLAASRPSPAKGGRPPTVPPAEGMWVGQQTSPSSASSEAQMASEASHIPPAGGTVGGLLASDRCASAPVASQYPPGWGTGSEGLPADLAVAALLHDVGKARRGIHLWHRVLLVLTGGQPPAWLARRPGIAALRGHAALGAELLAAAGAPPLAIDLVRHHHDDAQALGWPPARCALLAALQRADEQA